METRARKRVRVPDYEYDDEVLDRSAKRIKKEKTVKHEPKIKQEVKIKSEPSNNEIKSEEKSIKSEVKSEVKIELKKEKKEKAEVDSNELQNIDYNIAERILHNLKLHTLDLKALSETCSSWHANITTYLRERWARTLPFTHRNFTKRQKVDSMGAIGKVRQFVNDIQILEFNESVDSHNETVSLPWCPYIVVVKSRNGGSILDLRNPDPIVSCPDGIFEHQWGGIFVVTNNHRKQLVVSKRALSRKAKQEEGNDGPYKHALCIYNVSDDGKVDLVKQINTKEVDSPYAAYMQDDGSLWVAWETKVEIYNVETSKVDTYDYPGTLGSEPDRNIMEFIEHHGTIKFVVQVYITGTSFDEDEYKGEEEQILTLLYDTKTRQHEELPVEVQYQESYSITYINDSLQFTNRGHLHESYSLEPTIQRQISQDSYYPKSHISLSPDGSRLLEYKADGLDVQISLKDKSKTRSKDQQNYHNVAKSKILFFYEDPKDEREVEVPVEKKKRKKRKSIIIAPKKSRPRPVADFVEIETQLLRFFWLSNDIIVAVYRNRISILDFRHSAPKEGFKSFELPFLDDPSVQHMARLSDTSFVITHDTPNLKIE